MPSVVAADEDQLVLALRVEESARLGAGLLVRGCRALAELVDAAVDVGAIHLVELADGVDHRERLLRGGGAIQIHQRLAVDRLLEDRKVLADPLHVESGRKLATEACSLNFSNRIRSSASFERLDLDAVDDVLRERIRQQAARIALADAARPQVEHRFRVQLADGRAVRAAHVVGENLQLGLGVDHRSSESTRFLLVCLESVFCASLRT